MSECFSNKEGIPELFTPNVRGNLSRHDAAHRCVQRATESQSIRKKRTAKLALYDVCDHNW